MVYPLLGMLVVLGTSTLIFSSSSSVFSTIFLYAMLLGIALILPSIAVLIATIVVALTGLKKYTYDPHERHEIKRMIYVSLGLICTVFLLKNLS